MTTPREKPTYWPPLYKSFEAATKNDSPAIKLNLIKADITHAPECDEGTFKIMTPEELKAERTKLLADVTRYFERYPEEERLDPEQDPDVSLMKQALDSLA